MRYDIFYCYFQKVAKAQKDSTMDVEYRESQKHFNFREIDGDIQTLENSFIEMAPTKSKHLLLACGSFVAACVYSWQVTLVILLGMLLIVIFNFFVTRCLARGDASRKALKDEMLSASRKAFKMKGVELNDYANKFDGINR
jgi:ABC-type multidrug transport system fused ATPase/permease subunit